MAKSSNKVCGMLSIKFRGKFPLIESHAGRVAFSSHRRIMAYNRSDWVAIMSVSWQLRKHDSLVKPLLHGLADMDRHIILLKNVVVSKCGTKLLFTIAWCSVLCRRETHCQLSAESASNHEGSGAKVKKKDFHMSWQYRLKSSGPFKLNLFSSPKITLDRNWREPAS